MAGFAEKNVGMEKYIMKNLHGKNGMHGFLMPMKGTLAGMYLKRINVACGATHRRMARSDAAVHPEKERPCYKAWCCVANVVGK